MSDKDSYDKISFLRKEVRRLRKSLDHLTPDLDALLRRRGFRVYRKNPADDLLVPDNEHLEAYYRMLHKYSFRLFLRDVIKHQDFFCIDDVAKYSSQSAARKYIRFISGIGMALESGRGFCLAKRPVKSFGETLEWYVAEILKREFCFEAIRGVKFRRPSIGGDYDIIAKFNGSLLYLEVKSSPPKQIYDREISAFLDRISDLCPEMAVFLMDTELRMTDKIVPMFEDELGKRHRKADEIIRIEKELFQISDRVFIINAKESIAGNIEKVLSRYFRR